MSDKNILSVLPDELTDDILLQSKAVDLLFNSTKKMMWNMVQYKELIMIYDCALKEIKTKFEVLDTEFKVKHQRNPISAIQTRIKKTGSIIEKMMKNGFAMSLDSVEKNINDIAGIRVICAYTDDIYHIADALLRQDDVTLVARKDYIKNPKPNGYRSLHLIVSVPVFFADKKKDVKVEVQIRTIAMDFWASLEHQMKYKHNIPNSEEISEKLKQCADVIANTDNKMYEIRKEIEDSADRPTEEDILFEKMKHLDVF